MGKAHTRAARAKILVVNADAARGCAIDLCLREAGFEVRLTETGAKAMRLVAEQKPNLVVLDIHLPDGSGMEICQRLRGNSPTIHIPILQTSALPTSTHDRIASLESGADAFLAAPFEPRELLAQIKALLRVCEAARAHELQAKADFFATALEKSSQPFAAGYPDGRLLFYNQAFVDLTGYSEEELRSTTWAIDLTPPEWREHEARVLAKLHRTGQPQIYQKEYLRKDGTRVPLELNVHLVRNERGEPDYYYSFLTDISERKRAEEQLHRNHDTFYHLIQNNPFGVYVVDAGFQLRQVSAGAQKVFSNIRPLIGRDFAEVLRLIWTEPFASEAIARFRHTLATGEPYTAPSTVEQRQDIAEVEAYDWRIERITLPDGRFGVVCYFYDLSERQRWEAALRESEQTQKTIIEHLAEGLIVVSPQGAALHWNRAALEMHGYEHHEDELTFLRSLSEIYELLTLEGQVIPFEQWPVPRLMRGERVRDYELLLRHKQKNWQRIFSYGGVMVRGEHGEPKMGLLTIRDITEHKRIEARLRRFYDSGMIGVIYWNMDGGITDANDKFLAMVGYTRDDLQAGLVDWGKMTPPEYGNLDAYAVSELKSTGVDTPYEKEFIRKDGARLSIVIGAAMLDEQRFEGVAFVLDITERKRMEKELRLAKDELTRANADLENKIQERTARLQEMVNELEHFSYTITHDMRAPLRAMQGFAQMLQSDCAECEHEQRRDFLRRIAEAARRMDALITDALNYSKVVQGQMELKPLDAGTMLRSLVESYPQFQSPRAEIQIKTPFPLILGNEAGLTQCFSNLLGNAIKFVHPGQVPHVRVWAENRDEMVRIWFEDNGIGIDPQFHHRIFTMFQRLSKNYEGTGIGLALVRKVTERMGGRAWVESELGNGSRFWIELKPWKGETTE